MGEKVQNERLSIRMSKELQEEFKEVLEVSGYGNVSAFITEVAREMVIQFNQTKRAVEFQIKGKPMGVAVQKKPPEEAPMMSPYKLYKST